MDAHWIGHYFNVFTAPKAASFTNMTGNMGVAVSQCIVPVCESRNKHSRLNHINPGIFM